jgi:hypothetical protein
MKKKWVVVLLTMLLILFCFHYYTLNKQYPNPRVYEAQINKKMIMGDYSIEMVSWEWNDGEVIKDIVPDYSILTNSDGTDYPNDKEKVALATIQITKNGNIDDTFDFTNVAIESGAWHNQWDSVVFEAINGEDCYSLDMKNGEKKQITIPIVLYDFQFSDSQWNSIEKRKFCVVFSNYPDKYMLTYSGSR